MFSSRRSNLGSWLATTLVRSRRVSAPGTPVSGTETVGRPKRVAFFAPLADPNLLQRVDFYRADIDAWRKAGHHVRVATSLSKVDPFADVYFVWWWTHALPVVLLARLRRKPVYITGTFNWDTNAPGSYSDRPRHHRLLIDASAKLATQNLIPSKAELSRLQTEYGLSNASYFPHRVRPPERRTTGKPRSPATKQVAGHPFLFSMAWSGKLNLRRKCVLETLEAFSLVADDHPDFALVLAGNEGDGAAELRQQVQQHSHTERIIMLGPISESDREWLMSRCTMFVSPSRYEGFGLAIAEAAAFSKPIVTNDVGAITEVLGPNGAFYSKSTDAADIAEAINRLLSDEVEVKRVVTAAEESVSRFTLDAKVDQIHELLEPGKRR